MKTYSWLLAAAIVAAAAWAPGPSARAEVAITGAKFNAFVASPDNYLEQPVVLEGTFEGIAQKFTRIETENYYTRDMYVKFKLGQSPYPCLGLKTALLESGLDKCGRGDLVRVYGNLTQIWQSRTMATVQGQYESGRSWDERINVYGPLASEYVFVVGKVEKGWGRHDTPAEMFAECGSLKDEHYEEVPLAEINIDPGRLVERAVCFQGAYEGLDSRFSVTELAAGMTPESVLKFSVKGQAMGCYVPKSDAALAAFQSMAAGTMIDVSGRIRLKETPKGDLIGFIVDRVTRKVRRTQAAPAAATPAQAGRGA